MTSLLGGAFRIDAKAEADAVGFRRGSVNGQLADGVKHNVIRIVKDGLEVAGLIGGAKYVNLAIRHFLPAKSGFDDTACLRTGQIGRQDGIEVIVGEGLLRKENPTTGVLLNAKEDFSVFFDVLFINYVAWSGKLLQGLCNAFLAQSVKYARH